MTQGSLMRMIPMIPLYLTACWAVIFVTGCPGTTPQGPADVGDRIELLPGGAGQVLVPVQIGNQIFDLLLDTGAREILLFDDLIDPENSAIQRTGESIDIVFGSGTRSGVVAVAPVQLGTHRAQAMRIMLIQDPRSDADPSLAAKGADGIFGMRFNPGEIGDDEVVLDIPLLELEPTVREFQLDLPPGEGGSLVLGAQPILDFSDPEFIFNVQTVAESGDDRIRESFADLEVPFRVATSAGVANAADLDILLDTGAVSELVLDQAVASQLGWDADESAWLLPNNELVELSVVGDTGLLPLSPPFRVDQVRVADLSGATYDAVLGLDRWQRFVIGFTFVDFSLGGPEGRFRFINRDDVDAAFRPLEPLADNFIPLPGLNSPFDEISPSISADGTTIAFDSRRPSGMGGLDIFVYSIGVGLIATPGLNSTADDFDPAISEDGNLVLFGSDRDGQFDILLYDVAAARLVEMPGLNTEGLERSPYISPDGRYVSFRSERTSGETPSDVFLYDRQTEQLVDLPGLSSPVDDFTSALSRNAEFIVFDSLDREGAQGNDDVFLYDRTTESLVQLPQIVNTGNLEVFVAISADSRFIAYVSDGDTRLQGAAGRDIKMFDLAGAGAAGVVGRFVELDCLNSAFEEGEPALDEDGGLIAFNSRRPGGEGGLDIYLYARD